MKILYFHQYFCTPKGAGGTRSFEFARRWAQEGHEVTVITSSGYDETLRAGRSDIAGINVNVVGGVYRPTMGFVRRLWSYLAFAIQSSWIAMRSRRFDVVLATSTPLTIAIPALIAKTVARQPVVFEVRDVWPDAAVDAGILKKGFLYHIALLLEMAAYRQCDHIVALSDGMRDRIMSKGVSADKISMLPNCSDIKQFSPSLFDPSLLRGEFGVKDELVLLYVGAINTANDIPFLVKCIESLKDEKRIKWWFVGGGNRLNYLEEQVSQQNIKNVQFWGKRPKSEVPKFVNAADVGVVSFINKPVYYENSPNKFFDYISGGLPPVFTRSTWLKSYLERYDTSLICENNTVDEFVSYIERLISDSTDQETLSKNVLKLAKNEFSRDVVSGRYIKLLGDISGNS